MKNDNRGVSLVELIIVIAIMAVVVGGTAYGLNMVSGKPAAKCAQKIVYGLTRMRTTAMGKQDAYYKLYLDGGNVKVEEMTRANGVENKKDAVVIGDSTVKVQYKKGGAATLYDLDSTGLTFQFARGSGSLLNDCSEIQVSRGGHTYTVKLEQLTGKVYME